MPFDQMFDDGEPWAEIPCIESSQDPLAESDRTRAATVREKCRSRYRGREHGECKGSAARTAGYLVENAAAEQPRRRRAAARCVFGYARFQSTVLELRRGNIRELQNVVERAVILAGDGRTTADHIRIEESSQDGGRRGCPSASAADSVELETSQPSTLSEIERRSIATALRTARRMESFHRRFEVQRMDPIGRRVWAIAEGYIPGQSTGPAPTMTSHETASLLNTSDEAARIEITIFFKDREPAGPYRVTVEPRRTLHLRFNDLSDPEPIPRDTDYASVFRSSIPIVVQHTRLDSRQNANALLSTIAWSD